MSKQVFLFKSATIASTAVILGIKYAVVTVGSQKEAEDIRLSKDHFSRKQTCVVVPELLVCGVSIAGEGGNVQVCFFISTALLHSATSLRTSPTSEERHIV
jgi:hypothetical protein